MIPAIPQGSSLQTSSSASAAASSRSGNVDSYFQSGDFIVGGSKNSWWNYAIIAGIAVAFLYFWKKK